MDSIKTNDRMPTNMPVTFTIYKRGKSYPNKFKEGELQYMYILREQDGTESVLYANQREEDSLHLFNPGEQVIGTRKEATGSDGKRFYFREWSAVGDVTTTSAPQLRSNVQQQTQLKHAEAYRAEQDEKNICVCLQGYHQRLLPVVLRSGETNSDQEAVDVSLRLAVMAREALLKKAKELAS